MRYVHGHGACVNNQCPMFGLNQAECCDGVNACDSAMQSERSVRPNISADKAKK